MAGRDCLVSIIITTYNRPQFIIRALDNLLQQSYRPLEVLVVDDGSGTATASAIACWQCAHKPDPDFKLDYRWQQNRGPASARNAGLMASSGKLIQFLDDDDLLGNNALAHLAAALDPDKAAIGMASYQYCFGTKPAGLIHFPANLSRRERLKSMIAGQWFVPIHGYLFTRHAIDQIGPWNPVLVSQEDDEFLLRAALAADMTFKSVPRARVFYCQHQGFRRSMPGKPGETVNQGTVKRMNADLIIRETFFANLNKGGHIDAYLPDFLMWYKRFHKRYAQLMAASRLESDLLNWLDSHDERRAGDRQQPFVPGKPDEATWRMA